MLRLSFKYYAAKDRRDSMISAFRVRLVVSGRVLCDIDTEVEYNSELLNHVSNNWKIVAGQN